MGIRMENERLLHDAEKKRAFCLEILYSLSEAFHLLCHIYEEVYDLSRLPPQSACSCDRCVCVIKILNLRHVRSSSPSNCCKSTTRAMRSCWLCVSSTFSSDTSTTAATLTMSNLSAWHKQLRWQIRMQCCKKKVSTSTGVSDGILIGFGREGEERAIRRRITTDSRQHKQISLK